MRQIQFILIACIVISISAYSCKKDPANPVTEDIVSADAMDFSIARMGEFNDSVAHHHHDHDTTIVHHYDSLFHYHDSLYWHHHDTYHHGDTTHHYPTGHHTPDDHHQHDSIITAHLPWH